MFIELSTYFKTYLDTWIVKTINSTKETMIWEWCDSSLEEAEGLFWPVLGSSICFSEDDKGHYLSYNFTETTETRVNPNLTILSAGLIPIIMAPETVKGSIGSCRLVKIICILLQFFGATCGLNLGHKSTHFWAILLWFDGPLGHVLGQGYYPVTKRLDIWASHGHFPGMSYPRWFAADVSS